MLSWRTIEIIGLLRIIGCMMVKKKTTVVPKKETKEISAQEYAQMLAELKKLIQEALIKGVFAAEYEEAEIEKQEMLAEAQSPKKVTIRKKTEKKVTRKKSV